MSMYQELVDSPKGDHEHVPHSSIVENDDVCEVSMESPQVQTENLVEHVDVHSIPNQFPMAARSIDNSVVSREAVVISLEGTEEVVQADVNINVSHNQDEHVATEIQQQEVNPSKNIQHGLDLWERVRQYDAKSAVEGLHTGSNKEAKTEIKITTSLTEAAYQNPCSG